MSDRQYDVVLWGATGFTGQYVAEYLATTYGEDLAWAIAGRDRSKLERLRDEIGDVDILTGDALDRESLDAIAEQTRVVCTTVGPYPTYGSKLVAACIDNGTDYCDLTGEVYWMQQMIDEHHEQAREQGVRIVHGCGFDSIPSDIGTLLVQQHARETYGTPCHRVDAYVSSDASAASGGTAASLVQMYETMEDDPDARAAMASPYSLAPAGERHGPDTGSQRYPTYDEVTDQWTAPFFMSDINERVVRRSNALLEYDYGREFRYREVSPSGSGVTGFARAATLSAGFGLFGAAMTVSPLRSLLKQFVLPDPGEGPSREEIENNSFEVRLVGSGWDDDPVGEFTVEGRVAADSDPGYGATPWMLGESAVCLARGETDSPLPGGVLTPASGIGMPLVERLRDAGMTLEVE